MGEEVQMMGMIAHGGGVPMRYLKILNSTKGRIRPTKMRVLGIICALTFVATVVGAVHAQDLKRLEKAKAGQWVFQKSTSFDGATNKTVTHFYQWIDKVDGRKVHIKVQKLSDDGRMGVAPAIERVIDLATISARSDANAKITDDVVEVNGKKLKCKKRVETFDLTNMVSKSIEWTSDAVPIFGVVKVVLYGQDGKELASTELKDWGEHGGAEKPVK